MAQEAKDIAEEIYMSGAAMVRDFLKEERRSFFGASPSKYEHRQTHEIHRGADQIRYLIERAGMEELVCHRATVEVLRMHIRELEQQIESMKRGN